MATDANDLLHRFNPTLVLLPHDVSRPRPWSKWHEKVDEPRGDYHPCSAEFFLSQVVQRDEPRPWSFLHFTQPRVRRPLGLEELKQLVKGAQPGDTQTWEIDVAPIHSQHAEEAWVAYAAMLSASPWPQPAFVYARYVAGPPVVLEYWYLYLYNDAPNRHEGDWEYVAIELGTELEPVRVGYAAHGNGYARRWSDIQTRDGRPLVYVSRGSHAAYFEHKPDGHRTNPFGPSKGLPEPLESLYGLGVRKLQTLLAALRLVDRTASNPEAPVGHPRDLGVLVDPHVVVLPELEEGQASDDFWWVRLECRWGSRHSRIRGTIGPNPPWMQRDKWYEPSKWMDGLVQQ